MNLARNGGAPRKPAEQRASTGLVR